jgi:ATP-dependent Lon protease
MATDTQEYREVEAPKADSSENGVAKLPSELPLIGLDNLVLFPFMIAPTVVDSGPTRDLINDVLNGERLLGVALKRDPAKGTAFENLHETGTVAVVLKMLPMPDGTVRLLLHGVERMRIVRKIADEPYLKAVVEKISDSNAGTRTVQGMVKTVQGLLVKIAKMGRLPEDLAAAVLEMSDSGKLADLAISHLSVSIQERQEILEAADVEKRLTRVLEILSREIDLLELGSEIQDRVHSKMDKSQREYILREQLKAIKKELGDEERNPDIEELAQAAEKAKMPKYALEVVEREMKRLAMIHPSSPEYAVSRTYLDWLVSLPWDKQTRDNVNIEKAKRILDEDHYDLADVKERILEYLAVIRLKKEIRGPILCFVGPPGVGKTSLGRSIARALGRKFHRMSLGGMRDEAEIRGHRRTYIGSLPGQIIKGLRDCGSNNPLIMLDEIDKVGTDFRGDPSAALLEALDPEQNYTFTDHYLDMPFDLSKVMFITTANLLDPIPPPLRDRMETLRLSGYTTRQKLEIAKRYLVPRSHKDTGVTADSLHFTDEGLVSLIDGYTREAGVRNLEREIGNICRKVAKNVAMGSRHHVTATPERIQRFLGPPSVYHETADRMGQPGVAVGMAWTEAGGEILFIEASAVPGSGQLLLTGQLGDVMKESGMAAVNYLHSNAKELGIPEDRFSRQNIHMHIPAGATPKDGPSAGITMAAALCSLLTDKPVRDSLAMTGEITLKGNVLEVGGIKEKILAAHRAGIREIILPRRCDRKLEKDVPPEVREDIRFHFVDHVSEVLRLAFHDAQPVRAAQKKAEPPPAPQAKKEDRKEEPARAPRVLRIEPDLPVAHGQHGKGQPVSPRPGPDGKPAGKVEQAALGSGGRKHKPFRHPGLPSAAKTGASHAAPTGVEKQPPRETVSEGGTPQSHSATPEKQAATRPAKATKTPVVRPERPASLRRKKPKAKKP